MVSHTEELVIVGKARKYQGGEWLLWLRKGRHWDEQLCGNDKGEEREKRREGGKLRMCKRQKGKRMVSPQYNPHVRMFRNVTGWLGDKKIHQADGTIRFVSCSTVSEIISLDVDPHKSSE